MSSAAPKFAIMTFMFKPWWTNRRMSHAEMLRGFAAAGAAGVEPFHLDFVEDRRLLKQYPVWLGDTGLRVPVVDVMCNLVYTDAGQRREGRNALREGLEICAQLGAEVAHVAGHRLRDGVSPADGRKMIADGLLEASDQARQFGLTLAIEDFNPSPTLICKARDCLEILSLTGNTVKFVFDTGNFLEVGERADDAFPLFAGKIASCHFKDFTPNSDKGYQGCDLGTGVIPNAAVAARLTENGYDGWVALETQGREEIDPVTAVRKELPLLKSWFGQ